MTLVEEKYIDTKYNIPQKRNYDIFGLHSVATTEDMVYPLLATSYKEMKQKFQKELLIKTEHLKTQHETEINELIFDAIHKLNVEITELNARLNKSIAEIHNK